MTPLLSTSLENTQALLERARDGDQNAQELLWRRFLPGLLRWAHGRLPAGARDLLDTNDLVQITLIKALRHVDRFEPGREGGFLAYLHTILRNTMRDEIRRNRRLPDRDTLDDFLPEDRPALLERTLGSDKVAVYERGLARLTVEQQRTVVLRLEFGWSFVEIAEALGRSSAEAARLQFNRALVRLARYMSETE